MSGSVLLGFLPWILFGLLSDWSMTGALLIAVGLSAGTTVQQFRKKRLKILDTSTFVLFAFLFVAVVVVRWEAIGPWMFVIVNLALTLIAWGSLAIGVPFTIQYAREQVDKELWETPGFLRVNQWITAVWALNFTIQTAVSIYRRTHHAGILLEMVWVPLTTGSIVFTVWFPGWWTRRAIAAEQRGKAAAS